MHDIGGLARPRRLGADPRRDQHTLTLRRRGRVLAGAVGQQLGEQIELGIGEGPGVIDEVQPAGIERGNALIHRLQRAQAVIQTKLRQRRRAEKTKHESYWQAYGYLRALESPPGV